MNWFRCFEYDSNCMGWIHLDSRSPNNIRHFEFQLSSILGFALLQLKTVRPRGSCIRSSTLRISQLFHRTRRDAKKEISKISSTSNLKQGGGSEALMGRAYLRPKSKSCGIPYIYMVHSLSQSLAFALRRIPLALELLYELFRRSVRRRPDIRQCQVVRKK